MVIETEKEVALALLGFLIATGMTLWLYQINFQGLGHLINWSKTVSCCLEGTKLLTNGTLFLNKYLELTDRHLWRIYSFSPSSTS